MTQLKNGELDTEKDEIFERFCESVWQYHVLIKQLSGHSHIEYDHWYKKNFGLLHRTFEQLIIGVQDE